MTETPVWNPFKRKERDKTPRAEDNGAGARGNGRPHGDAGGGVRGGDPADEKSFLTRAILGRSRHRV